MIKLNLEAKTDEEKYLRDYLENNASEILADKINNGVKIEKDGKTLINKKDLNSFMDFAYEEASKLRKNNERVLAVQKETVAGWAVHYFEEDSIVGKLFNEDGTEYKPPRPKVEHKPIPTPPPAKPVEKKPSLFDLLDNNPDEKENEPEEEPDEEEIEQDEEPNTDKIDEGVKVEPTEEPIIDKSTGEVKADKFIADLYDTFDEKLRVKL